LQLERDPLPKQIVMGCFSFFSRGKPPADGRPLEPHDSYYFDNGFAPLSGIFAFSAKGLGSDARLRASFRRAVQNSPILQTRVEGSGDAAIFRGLSTESQWPALHVAPCEADDAAAFAAARALLAQEVSAFMTGGQEAQRISVRLHVVRGSQMLVFALASPHHFCDGTALASLMCKLYAYALSPKCLWACVDLLSDADVPSYSEMAFKSEIGRYEVLDGFSGSSLSKRYSPDNFRFTEYDMTSGDAASRLKGLDGTIAIAPTASLQEALAGLRASGVTLTSAFGALAIKVLAKILTDAGGQRPTALLGTNGVDTRGLGQWTARSSCGGMLPVVANYTFASHTQVPFAAAQSETLEQIAARIKTIFERISSDTVFRMHEIAASAAAPLPSSNMFCGCSSILIPRFVNLFGIDATVESRIAFGPVPRVWFYVVTCGAETTVEADIALPLGLSADGVREVVHETMIASTLEPLLRMGASG